MPFTPHEYQQRAIKFAMDRMFVRGERGAGLLMDPGLGKTSCTLSILEQMKYAGELDTALIVAPLRVCYNVWPAEIMKWGFDLTYEIVHGTPIERELSLLKHDRDVHIINPEGVPWLAGQSQNFRPDKYDTLIIDESTKFKNWSAARTKALRKLLKHFRRRIILTGTPSPNGMQDLFAQAFILDNGRALGRTVTEFRNAYCQRGGFQGREWVFRRDRKAAVEKAIADLVIRLDAKDHLDLPPLLENDIWVELPKDAKSVYKTIERDLIAELQNGQTLTASSASGLYGKCKQIANGGGYAEGKKIVHVHDAKAEAVLDVAEELDGRPLLVAYQYAHDLERLLNKFPKAPAVNGGTKPKETSAILNDWNAGRIPVLLCQPQAVSHGLNMQRGGCNHIAWVGLSDSLEVYDQFNARVYRQGVEGTVVVHRILAMDTVDLPIRDRIEGKSESQTALLDALKAYGRAMSG